MIGIDAGSRFLKIIRREAVSFSLVGNCEHHGNPETAVQEILGEKLSDFKGTVAVTGNFGKELASRIPGAAYCDEISAVIEAVRYYRLNVKYIINVGAGSIRYIELDEDFHFRGYRENGLCAAGTGSFLDEQMRRMGFGYEDLLSLALEKDPPAIASRCAVFAKSDLIHRQQEGYTRVQMWSGLARGVVDTMLSTLFKGNMPEGEMLFCGGIFRDPSVRYWTSAQVAGARFHDMGHALIAIGAILCLERGNAEKISSRDIERGSRGLAPAADIRVLQSVLSPNDRKSLLREYESGGNEVRVHAPLEHAQRVALGIDIGSTSTKCVLLDVGSHEVLIDIYRKTAGQPLIATRRLFQELRSLLEGRSIELAACGTTGSGRRLVGELCGADLIVNEISAHFAGAKRVDSSLETVFEIGGQDAKYIRGSGGRVVDAAMNYVCAAGTGSFIEEQAARLGIEVGEIGGRSIGRQIPHVSDRCTVFMEQDINRLLREGRSREEVMAAVIYAVAKNYLHRVVGQRPVTGDRIFFQGATARNEALVAAFEQILGRAIVVSPHCHVMGAMGAALLALEKTRGEKSKFRGLECFDREIALRYLQCADCANRCAITAARMDGREISWGFMCGREGFHDRKRPGRGADHVRRVASLANRYSSGEGRVDAAKGFRSPPPSSGRRRDMTAIGIPMVLSMFEYLPLWKIFLERLGFKVILSENSTHAHKELGARLAKSDFCFPMKLSLAHVDDLARREGVDAVFFPTVISERRQDNGMPRIFCPYVISFPSLSKNAVDLAAPVIAPELDFRMDEGFIVDALHRAFAPYDIGKGEISEAYREGRAGLEGFRRERAEYGKRLIDEMMASGKKGIVFMGRPYNLYDAIINLGLTERFRAEGLVAFPFECLIDPDERSRRIEHMYWNYGERILSAAEKIRGIEGLYPVYFTNFGCGPDSFVLSRFEELMRGKPYLIIELDEHGSGTGYQTRIEAFMDVVAADAGAVSSPSGSAVKFRAAWRRRGRKIWIPPMHEFSACLSAACFRAWGFDAEALPVEDPAALEIGRQGVRGSECLPAHTTIGAFLKKMREIGAVPGEHAFFMPTAEGPCRFGQYTVLHRRILDGKGFRETPIFSPTSVNSYMGMPNALRRYLWDCLIAGDLLMKGVCTVRPYEKKRGETDARAREALQELELAIERRSDCIAAARRALAVLDGVSITRDKKPLVGIVGEIYVRCNPFCNGNLVRSIESFGGEAWLAPVSEWILYTSWMERYFSKIHGRGFLERAVTGLKTKYMFRRMERFEREIAPALADRMEPHVERVIHEGARYLPLVFEGEAILTLGRAVRFLREGAAMVVNAAPFGCMPGNLTNALFQRIQRELGKPVLSLFYDGEKDINRIVGVYLRNLRPSPQKGLDASPAHSARKEQSAEPECEAV